MFIALYGAEMMLEIARFWGLKATYNEKTDRYDIEGQSATRHCCPPPSIRPSSVHPFIH
jgi:hypothetical protein